MADADPPPIVDRNPPDDIDPVVRDFLEAMKATNPGTTTIDAVGRKLYSYKVSLYFSVADPSVPNAVRVCFAKWLNELSKFRDLQGADFSVTNCNDELLVVPSLLYDAEFQKLTGWEKVNSRKMKNVYLCVKMKVSTPFSRLKHRLKPFLFASNTFMQRNHSVGDSSEEMAIIGYFSPVLPDLHLAHLQKELNHEIQYINEQKDDDFLTTHRVRRGVPGELVIAHGAIRGTSKQHGVVINSKAIVVECPKSKSRYYLQTVQKALHVFDWSPDLKKIKFVPFALKADAKTNEIFTNMIVYNSIENNTKAYAQILGVGRDDMLGIRDLLISECPLITHIDPTHLTVKQGRWRIYTSTGNLDAVEKWLSTNLARLVDSVNMCVPVPGFEIPRLVVSSRISSEHVDAIAAVSTTVPALDDGASFPNLVIDRSRRPKSATGAWTASPTVASTPSQLTPATHTVTPRDRSQPSFDSSDHPVAASAVLSDLQQQLEDQRKYRRQLEISRVIEQAEHVEFKDTIAALRVTLEAEQLDFQHQLDHTTAVLGQLTLGQAEIQTSMSEQKSQHSSEISALRDDVAALTDSI